MSLLLLIVQTMRQLAATPNRKIRTSHRNHTICNKRNATEDSLITIGNFHTCCQVSYILIPTMQIILIYVNESHAFQRSIPSILMDSFLQKKKVSKKKKSVPDIVLDCVSIEKRLDILQLSHALDCRHRKSLVSSHLYVPLGNL